MPSSIMVMVDTGMGMGMTTRKNMAISTSMVMHIIMHLNNRKEQQT